MVYIQHWHGWSHLLAGYLGLGDNVGSYMKLDDDVSGYLRLDDGFSWLFG